MFRHALPMSARLALDMVLAVLLAVLLGARLSGERGHEWMGMAFLFLVALHVWLNRAWAAALLRGRYPFRRKVGLIVNLALAGLILIIAWAGLMNSRFVLGFLHLEGGMAYRKWHSVASYWLLILTGTHLGLHWAVIAAWLRRALPGVFDLRFAKVGIRGLWLLVLAAGVWASFDRDMGSKLFRGFGFDYWDPDRPLALFYASTLAIMGLWAWITRLAIQTAERIMHLIIPGYTGWFRRFANRRQQEEGG